MTGLLVIGSEGVYAAEQADTNPYLSLLSLAPSVTFAQYAVDADLALDAGIFDQFGAGRSPCEWDRQRPRLREDLRILDCRFVVECIAVHECPSLCHAHRVAVEVADD